MRKYAIKFDKPKGPVLVAGIEAEDAEQAMFTYLRWMDGENCPIKTADEPTCMIISGTFHGQMLRAVPA